jgi:hypothetical protein
VVDGRAEVARDEAREQDARRTEPDAADLQATEGHAGTAHERDHADRVGDDMGVVQLEQPAHLPTGIVRVGMDCGMASPRRMPIRIWMS